MASYKLARTKSTNVVKYPIIAIYIFILLHYVRDPASLHFLIGGMIDLINASFEQVQNVQVIKSHSPQFNAHLEPPCYHTPTTEHWI